MNQEMVIQWLENNGFPQWAAIATVAFAVWAFASGLWQNGKWAISTAGTVISFVGRHMRLRSLARQTRNAEKERQQFARWEQWHSQQAKANHPNHIDPKTGGPAADAILKCRGCGVSGMAKSLVNHHKPPVRNPSGEVIRNTEPCGCTTYDPV